MNRSIGGIWKMMLLDVRTSAAIFWAILFFVYGLLALLLYRFGGGEATTGGLTPMYIYMVILGIVALRETLPYALGMSVRRKDYYFGLLGGGLAVAAAFSAFSTLLSRIEQAVFAGADIRISFFSMPVYRTIGLGGEWGSQFVFLASAFALGMMLALLHKRFGNISLYLFFAGLFLAATALHLFDGWPAVFEWLLSLDSIVDLSLWVLPVTALLALVSFVLLRRATV
ncbi:hypothetical protein [Paenibacillus sp.]|uniref:hypothetical protein n=1 Tax=Paenibacillus sp. TaxID=58172 RepID=UPI002D3395E4|nr:hypothetical protein [Paenibacillus sp.]HZG86459.1 hypothetical protein [Paenibacillus sp.]